MAYREIRVRRLLDGVWVEDQYPNAIPVDSSGQPWWVQVSLLVVGDIIYWFVADYINMDFYIYDPIHDRKELIEHQTDWYMYYNTYYDSKIWCVNGEVYVNYKHRFYVAVAHKPLEYIFESGNWTITTTPADECNDFLVDNNGGCHISNTEYLMGEHWYSWNGETEWIYTFLGDDGAPGNAPYFNDANKWVLMKKPTGDEVYGFGCWQPWQGHGSQMNPVVAIKQWEGNIWTDVTQIARDLNNIPVDATVNSDGKVVFIQGDGLGFSMDGYIATEGTVNGWNFGWTYMGCGEAQVAGGNLVTQDGTNKVLHAWMKTYGGYPSYYHLATYWDGTYTDTHHDDGISIGSVDCSFVDGEPYILLGCYSDSPFPSTERCPTFKVGEKVNHTPTNYGDSIAYRSKTLKVGDKVQLVMGSDGVYKVTKTCPTVEVGDGVSFAPGSDGYYVAHKSA
jgi:hypothetical protein